MVGFSLPFGLYCTGLISQQCYLEEVLGGDNHAPQCAT
jgi:hypothetical protein